jgi:hypothetical protein
VANGSLAADASLTFTISTIITSGQPRPGQLTIDYYNLGGADDDSMQVSLRVENAPVLNQPLVLNKGFQDSRNNVYVAGPGGSPIANSITFYLSNPSPTEPILNSATGSPVFNLSFVYGRAPGYGALTTAGQGALFAVSIAEQYQDLWTVTPNLQGTSPYWTLTPQGREILGIGDAATVEFTVSNIISDLQPGVTLLYIQYANIPGYDDGGFALDLEKDPGPAIARFTADPGNIPTWADSMPTTLAWTADNADFVTFNQEVGGSLEYDTTGTLGLVVERGQEITITAHRKLGDSPTGGGEVTASATLAIQGIEMSIVETGFQAAGAVLIPPEGDLIYIVEATAPLGPVLGSGGTSSRIAAMRRSDFSIQETIDLNSALDPALGDDNRIIGTYLTADGSTLYAMLAIGDSQSLALVAVDTAANMPALVKVVSEFARSATNGSMVTTPDGTTLYAYYWYTVFTDSGTVDTHAIIAIDLVTRAQIYSYQWPPDEGGPVSILSLLAVSPDGKRILAGYVSALGWIDISGDVAVLTWSTIDAWIRYQWESFINPIITSDRSRIFMALLNHISIQGGTADVMILSLDLDIATQTIAPGGESGVIGIASGGMNAINTLALALSPDNKTLALTYRPGQIAVIDAATLEFHTAVCGTPGDFAPVFLAVDNGGVAVYGTGYSQQQGATINAVRI